MGLIVADTTNGRTSSGHMLGFHRRARYDRCAARRVFSGTGAKHGPAILAVLRASLQVIGALPDGVPPIEADLDRNLDTCPLRSGGLLGSFSSGLRPTPVSVP